MHRMSKSFQDLQKHGIDTTKIVGIYVLFGIAWIYGSDSVLGWLVHVPAGMVRVEVFKGSLFILCTAILLYFLISRFVQQLVAAETCKLEMLKNYQAIFNATKEAIFIHDAQDGTILDVNDRMLEVFGYDRAGALSLRISDLSEGTPPFSQVEAVEKVRSASVEGPQFFEWLLRKKTGELFWSEISLNIVSMNGHDRIIAVVRDISERKKAEQQLAESHKLLDDLAQMVPGVIYQYRLFPDGRSTFPYVSQGMNSIYEVTPEQVREDASPVFSRMHPEDHDRVAEAIFKSAQTLELFYCEFRVILPKQGLRWRWSQAQPQLMEDGSTLWHGIISDITERKQAEEEKIKLEAQLLQAQKMEAIGALAGGIAHDFNNLLSAILGYTEIACDSLPPGTVALDYLDKVLGAGQRASSLVKQILAFSRQVSIEYVALQPSIIIKEVIKILRSSLPSTITIRPRIDTDTKSILADPTQLHQVLMNLCTNAFHAMEKSGGTLEIVLEDCEISKEDLKDQPGVQPGSFVVLSIKDSGQGIPPEIRDKIFDPYFTTKEVGKGTGRGLSIVHGIIKKYGGFIICESTVGTGTVFKVYFPSVPQEISSTTKSPIESVPRGKECILLVDDEEMLVDMGKVVLERLGYEVVVQTSSLAALDTFQEEPNRFDAVITDQTMPGMTGIDLAEKMMRIRPDIPIILCTGFSSVINEEQAKSEGIRAFVMKPLSQKRIATILRGVLDQKSNFGLN